MSHETIATVFDILSRCQGRKRAVSVPSVLSASPIVEREHREPDENPELMLPKMTSLIIVLVTSTLMQVKYLIITTSRRS